MAESTVHRRLSDTRPLDASACTERVDVSNVSDALGVADASGMHRVPNQVPPERRGLLDPRSMVLLTVSISTVAVMAVRLEVVLAAIASAGIFILLSLPRDTFVRWALFTVGCLMLACVFPHIYPHPVIVILSFVGYWFAKYTAALFLILSFFRAVTPHEVSMVLIRMRMPTVLYVPIMVMVRFFPVAHRELRDIRSAMMLRGLAPTPWSASLHPLRSAEMLVIPFLLSMTRCVDELSAAALIKGVGSREHRRTCTLSPRFTRYDVLALVLCAGLWAYALRTGMEVGLA